MFYQADGTISNGYLTTHYINDCCDISAWGTHQMPLGFLAYNTSYIPLSMFLWGESNYSISNYKETKWTEDQAGSGSGKVKHDAVKAIDSFSDGDLVILEGSPEFTIERWDIISTAIFRYGAGGQGDDDHLFNNPKDVTVDLLDNVYVLDVLSNGKPRIKIFNSQLQPVMGMGDSTVITGTPKSCDWNDCHDALHVLHSDGVAIIYM